MPPCAVKTCAVRPVFVRVIGSCGQQSQANVQGLMKQNASPEQQSEAPRRRWKPGQEQHPGPPKPGQQHMLNQPRGSFPDKKRENWHQHLVQSFGAISALIEGKTTVEFNTIPYWVLFFSEYLP